MKNLPFNQSTTILTTAAFVGIGIYLLSFDWIGIDGFWFYRGSAIMATGVIAFTFMTLCMVSVIRSKTIENHLHGLDKAYHLHKWAAILAFICATTHWFAERGIKLLATSGLVNFPPRVKTPAPDPQITTEWWGLIDQLTPFAKAFGEYGFYILIAFILCALLSMIPYSIFQKIHRYIAIFYIFIAFHSVILMPTDWWSTPAAYLITALSIVGIYCAACSLLRIYQRKNKIQLSVESIKQTQAGVIDLTLQLKHTDQFKYKAGQFVFIDFSPVEGAHPFSIASATSENISFSIKPTGDFTKKILKLVHTGQTLSIEGPYGEFDFESPQPNQVWIAGGIGISPFISQLQALIKNPNHGKKINFWYSAVTEEDHLFPSQLDELCKKANVKLHRVISTLDGRLNAEKIKTKIGQDQIQNSSFWFCGPQNFGESLKNSLYCLGVKKINFHFELFNFR